MAMTRAQKVANSYSGFLGANGGPPQAPANTAVPTVSGTAKAGETLAASAGTWTGRAAPYLTYQWLRGSTPIDGATGLAYVVAADDVGARLRVRVTGQNWAGSASAQSAQTVVVVA